MMNIETLRDYCLAKAGATESFPFDDETLVFKVAGKIFACVSLDKPDWLVLKCDAERAIDLRERYSYVEPAWHLNKKYWNQIRFSSAGDGFVMELIDHSYSEVLKKLPKKQQNALSQ